MTDKELNKWVNEKSREGQRQMAQKRYDERLKDREWKEQQRARTLKMQRRSDRRYGVHMGCSILGIVVCVLLLVSIVRILSGSSDIPTFRSFMELLMRNSKATLSMNLNTVNTARYLVEEWTILDGLRNFLYQFCLILDQILNIVIFFCKGIYNVCVYLFTFISWAFVKPV